LYRSSIRTDGSRHIAEGTLKTFGNERSRDMNTIIYQLEKLIKQHKINKALWILQCRSRCICSTV